ALYVSIATDCGWFRFSNTTADTMRVAAELIRAGAVPVKMDERLHFNDTPAKLRLWGRCMARVETVGARAALSWITRDDFRETGALESDTEGLINMLTHIKGADVTVMISEVKDCLRCSVRSRGPVSAQAIAAKWNGGGHRYAAGCKIYLPLEEGLKALEEELSRV
ncbi:DHH family phosphoesterase, partial [Pyramidobacter piscolens]